MKADNKDMGVAFFIGNDLTSYILAYRTAEDLIKLGIRVLVISVESVNKKSAKPPLILSEFLFFERSLLNQHVIPLLDSLAPSEKRPIKSLGVLSHRSGGRLSHIRVSKVNSSETVDALRFHRIGVGLSIRCYQKFGASIISYFTEIAKGEPAALMNLHPGLLPNYRGVITFFRAMQNRETQAGFTLHYIDLDWDAGPIIQSWPIPLDYKKSVLANMIAAGQEICSSTASCLVECLEGNHPKCFKQEKDLAHYYTFPSEEELYAAKLADINLFKPEDFTNLYCQWFAQDQDILCNNLISTLKELPWQMDFMMS